MTLEKDSVHSGAVATLSDLPFISKTQFILVTTVLKVHLYEIYCH